MHSVVIWRRALIVARLLFFTIPTIYNSEPSAISMPPGVSLLSQDHKMVCSFLGVRPRQFLGESLSCLRGGGDSDVDNISSSMFESDHYLDYAEAGLFQPRPVPAQRFRTDLRTVNLISSRHHAFMNPCACRRVFSGMIRSTRRQSDSTSMLAASWAQKGVLAGLAPGGGPERAHAYGDTEQN